MRMLFIRHGDPDYVHDTLTEKGRREAALLAKTIASLEPGSCFVSPLGRAQATASYSLKALHQSAETLDWLMEFPAKVDLERVPELRRAYPDARIENGVYVPHILWDMAPGYWTEHPEYFDGKNWRDSLAAKSSDLLPVYDSVIRKFDEFLAAHGYVREGAHYRVERESTETVTFFCHFGITCVLLSRLWGVSPFVLWHSLALAPTSVTEVVSEEREQKIAYFRGLRLGDISHLYAGGEKPSFSARFCEVFSKQEQRH